MSFRDLLSSQGKVGYYKNQKESASWRKAINGLVYILFVLLALLFTGNPYVWSANVTVLANPSKSEPANNKAIPVFELPMPVSEQEKELPGPFRDQKF